MDHTGEVTNNWFSVVLSQVNDPEFRRRSLRVRDEAINDWYFKGKIWDDWEVWLALETYVILAEEFGWWESYQPLNKLYRDGEPLEGISVLDSWAQNYMAQVGYDLCDYFEWWTWELSNDTYALCETLPPLGKDLMEAYRREFSRMTLYYCVLNLQVQIPRLPPNAPTDGSLMELTNVSLSLKKKLSIGLTLRKCACN